MHQFYFLISFAKRYARLLEPKIVVGLSWVVATVGSWRELAHRI